ncbi:M23 family metallopeptidase [Methylovirgula sp. 4M-Z18]|uniref:M23 family metallopeptidase n=1 Tax=Methylovirgula sp. 4M-Z18 TaxID=2293567 RepID=UPI000E2F54D6|nr:M23 family metallopeptidase [Methylovirgula sp. 4M-Z18]RFB76358.1 M23 family peptidase [Methylovirgula sp. 4M-Z18]
MADKTVIAGRTNPEPTDGKEQPAEKPEVATPLEDSNATIIAPARSSGASASRKPVKPASDGAAPAQGGGGKTDEKGTASPRGRIGAFGYISLLMALVFLGFGAAMTSIYIFSPARNEQSITVPESDLEANLVAVPSQDSEAEDEALIRAAIKPHIIELSGDPVIVPQLASAPRQLVKLANDRQRKAADSLGIKSDVFRLKDVLDLPTPESQIAVLGSQEDIAVAQDASAQASSDNPDNAPDTAGFSVIAASGAGPGHRIADFAQTAKAPTTLSDALKGLGLDAQKAAAAAGAFASFYSSQNLQSGDRYAVRATAIDDDPSHMQPVQVSVYSGSKLVGSIALNDDGAFVRSEDPWYQRDPFAAPLVPDRVNPEDQPRLLDAIYVTALRNRLPAPVVGETIMLLSRAQDLEQKVQSGDTITIVYSPIARDSKQGLGRIVFVSIGRTTGNLDCYVMQSQPGARYECVSSAGRGSVPDGGMITPVNGVIAARFGAQGTGDSASTQMNYGMDWTAPEGSPVVAAFAGQVTSIGNETGFGTVVRMSHDGGKTSMYGYLAHPATGLAVGSTVKAGQIIGYVGTPSTSREPRLHFEVRNNGVPVDPVAETQANTGTNSAVDQFVNRIIYIESGNKCTAANPLSTAVGLGQFIESTWMTTIRLHRPDLLVGRTRQEVLALRTDCDLSRTMTTEFTRDNAAVERQAGHPVTPGNLYLAHFLGVGGALKVLGSRPDLLIADVFGAEHVRANPFEQGKTIGYLISWAAQKMGGRPASAPPSGGGTTVAQNSGDKPTISSNNEPLAKFASDPAFSTLKTTVLAFLD